MRRATTLWVYGLLAVLGAVSLGALLAPWIAPYSYADQDLNRALKPPGLEHFFGTDSLGRDLFSRVLYGARVSIFVGVSTAVISVVLGTAYGFFSGWRGGFTDRALMKVVDICYAVPTMVLLILMSVLFNEILGGMVPNQRALVAIMAALCFSSWMGVARTARAQVLQLKTHGYVEAARAAGASGRRILSHHILPNALGPLLVLLTFQIPYNVLFESFLSFMGLGLQPPFASWGVLASEGWRTMRDFPHLILFPGAAIFFTMLAFHLLGDGLRDLLDPKH